MTKELEAALAGFPSINHGPIDKQWYARSLQAMAEAIRSVQRLPAEIIVCTGCGSVGTLDEIKAEHGPATLSCCPERKTVPVAEYIERLKAERDAALDILDDKVDRVAIALATEPRWNSMHEAGRDSFRATARKAIEAMAP